MARINSGWYCGLSCYDVGADAITYRDHILAMDTALNNDGISYRAQVQNKGWMPAVQNGTAAGTTGQSLRLEGIRSGRPGPA